MYQSVGVIESIFFFFFNDTATTEIYTLSLHDALPISLRMVAICACVPASRDAGTPCKPCNRTRRRLGVRRGYAPGRPPTRDRKSTRLNSSHANISYAVFCLKKKKQIKFITM